MARLTLNDLSLLVSFICCLLSAQCYADKWEDIYDKIFKDREKLAPNAVLSGLRHLLEIYPQNQGRIEEKVRGEIQRIVEAAEWYSEDALVNICKINLAYELAHESSPYGRNIREYLSSVGKSQLEWCLNLYRIRLSHSLNRSLFRELEIFANAVFAADDAHKSNGYHERLYQDDPSANSIVEGLLEVFRYWISPSSDASEGQLSGFENLIEQTVSLPCASPSTDFYPIIEDLKKFAEYADRGEVVRQLSVTEMSTVEIIMACRSYLKRKSYYIEQAQEKVEFEYARKKKSIFKIFEKLACIKLPDCK